MSAPPRIVLASASPRRADLLRQLGLDVDVRPADVDERFLPHEDPAAHVDRLARSKAEEVAAREPGALVVGGDTVVVLRGAPLGKPTDADRAVEMLLALSGRSHEVLTGVAIAGPHGTVSAMGRARVRFRSFDVEDARAYVRTGEPLDKAGAYGIQGYGAALVDELFGDYYTVVGFPVGRFLELLEGLGWRYAFGRLVPASDPLD
ncbi:MAG TPA: Maf family protein [Longimicrobiales bacterium]|nr:Maf family protein [Longimicrobiales bacterium]